ncbi:YcaO-like family protein [Staphylococcus ratti]|uniref:YcaO-like family protein n=1 Tax=Staphylococcus ratti TaxID=2892440 RepID=A0ABY3PB47_9STAP|nr:YcaO-like family protein [Staphylococcus ratti]UEX89530.1 YcaO-like family protein [Staphylococcus ratti]
MKKLNSVNKIYIIEENNIIINYGGGKVKQYILQLKNFKGATLNGGFLICGGVDLNYKIAKEKAVSECIERYTMNLFEQPSMLIDKSFSENINFLQDINGFKFSKVYSLLEEKETYIPSQMVNFKSEDHIYYPISSNGFAAHVNKEKIIESGVNECVERHLTLKNWICDSNKNYRLIPNDYLKNPIKSIVLSIEKIGYNVNFVYIKNKYKINCVNVFVVKNNRVLFGASANGNFDIAIRNSLFEAMSNLRCNDSSYYDDFNVDNVYLSRMAEIISNAKSLTREDYVENIHVLKSILKDKVEVYYANFNSKECKVNYNREVGRIIIPKFIYFTNKPTNFIKLMKKKGELNKLFESKIITPY